MNVKVHLILFAIAKVHANLKKPQKGLIPLPQILISNSHNYLTSYLRDLAAEAISAQECCRQRSASLCDRSIAKRRAAEGGKRRPRTCRGSHWGYHPWVWCCPKRRWWNRHHPTPTQTPPRPANQERGVVIRLYRVLTKCSLVDVTKYCVWC